MKYFRRISAAVLAAMLVSSICFQGRAEGNDFIKWVDFDVTLKAMTKALDYDITTYGEDSHIGWIDILSFLGAKYGGDFSKYREKDFNSLTERIKSGETLDDIVSDMKYFSYYREAYGAVLGGMVGVCSIEEPGENGEKVWKEKYGLKAFSPIAAGYYYSHYDDFGVKRSYGYKRKHLGHDMMGTIGTPIIAVESGIVEAMGWNQYGGWRIGIRSFDGLRYHYYAHLRQNRPFHEKLEVGKVVKAGDVIGYMGHTGYSVKENVNNIKETHLHYGLQLIFDESQKEGNGEIWVDVYALIKLLERNRSATERISETKEHYRKFDFDEPALHEN